MMADLRAQLERCTRGRACLMGIGNVEFGDDGFGVRLAEPLRDVTGADALPRRYAVVVAGTCPEDHIARALEFGPDHLLFIDAVDFGAPPGSAALLESPQIASRFPQVSTHRISLGLLAQWAERTGATRAWLLGVQPGSLSPGRTLTGPVQATLDALRSMLQDALGAPRPSMYIVPARHATTPARTVTP